MNYNMVGDAIVKHCGGLANFIHVTNCMTRVRMTIADTSLVDMTALKAIEGY
ncbi:PTS system transporter subunit IIBC [Klebsiella pneumoniae]|nr:PTS system transporter subunit IIBC [Klebsiella pneumoniae]